MEDLIIIGAGASGLLTAALVAKKGLSVTIIEHTDKAGKKILSTGNGKCNMTNYNMDSHKFYCNDHDFIESVLSKVSPDKLINCFEEMGVLTRSRDGYVYPYSEQAATIREVLLKECMENNVKISYETNVSDIEYKNNIFKITTDKGTFNSGNLLLSCGGKSFPKSGSDGSGYALAKNLGHSVTKTVPALTAMICREKYFKQVAGVRTKANVSIYCDNKEIATNYGEVQLTDYGISGIPAFNLSRTAAYLLKSRKQPIAIIDFMPDINVEKIESILSQSHNNKKRNIYESLSLMLNQKLTNMLLNVSDINDKEQWCNLSQDKKQKLLNNIKAFKSTVVNIKSFDFCQVTAGGINVAEINPLTMQSKLNKNLYFTGEIIDVDGICGGYNLHFAWATSIIASESLT